MAKKATRPKESNGTVIAAKARARANSYSDEKRQQLLDQGMAMIYGGGGAAKHEADVNRH